VRPAHERLDARELAGLDVDLRLVVNRQRAPSEGVLQVTGS